MRRCTTRVTRQRGVTLVELLVTMIVMGIVTAVLTTSWIALQSSYAHTVSSNDSQSTARDALARMGSELRDAQPPNLSGGSALFTSAAPTEADFYSSYNQAGTASDGSGVGTVLLTRVYLGGTAPYQTLYWQRDTDKNGAFDTGDRTMVLATNVVNNSITDTTVTPNTATTPIFTYTYTVSGASQTATTVPSASLVVDHVGEDPLDRRRQSQSCAGARDAADHGLPAQRAAELIGGRQCPSRPANEGSA